MIRETKCPYCNARLDPKPKRKKRCPSCGNSIYVCQGRLLTEEEATIEEWLRYLAKFGITRKKFNKYRKKLGKQFGFTPSVYDTIWRILNTIIQEAGYDFPTMRNAYLEMARLARREGKSPMSYLKEAKRMELLDLQSQGETEVWVVNCSPPNEYSTSCSACQKLPGRKFSIEEALRSLPVPTACESEEGCRCSYVPRHTWEYLESL